MIGLDTNIVLRYLFLDDPKQSPRARQIVDSLQEEQPGWIGLSTVLEIAWVMKSKRHASRTQIADTLEQFLTGDAIVVEQAQIVARAVQKFRSTRADFADCLIAESALVAGCARTLTFDETAASDLGMELVQT